MTDRQPAEPHRRLAANPLKLGALSIAALIALTGFFAVEARSHRTAHDGVAAGPGGTHLMERVAGKIERKAAELPEEFRHIRAAGVDGAAPAIPPSETWPAQ